jgi:hypothetical protein
MNRLLSRCRSCSSYCVYCKVENCFCRREFCSTFQTLRKYVRHFGSKNNEWRWINICSVRYRYVSVAVWRCHAQTSNRTRITSFAPWHPEWYCSPRGAYSSVVASAVRVLRWYLQHSQQVLPPSQKYWTQHTAFRKQMLPSSGEWFHLKKEAGRNVVRGFECFYDGRKTCCKCCRYHVSTAIVKSMYVPVMRVLFRHTLQQHSQNVSYLCKISEVLENLSLSPD